MHPRITDYWDHQVRAIFAHEQRLQSCDVRGRERALEAITAAVERHAEVLSDEHLSMAGFAMADDLYKAACSLSHWSQTLLDYLRASAGTFCRILKARGYAVRYVIDNSFEPTEIGLAGPVEWFPSWFRSAGFVYVCPQGIAWHLMKPDSVLEVLEPERDPWPQPAFLRLLPQYIAEGRAVAAAVLTRCREGGDHYLYLDTDATDPTIRPALTEFETPGAISIFRAEAPLPGSRCVVKITPPLPPADTR